MDLAYALNVVPELGVLRKDLRYRVLRLMESRNYPLTLLGPPTYVDVITSNEADEVQSAIAESYLYCERLAHDRGLPVFDSSDDGSG
jgi:hypothetical protein